MSEHKHEHIYDDCIGNPPFDGAIKILDENYLTEPQRKHFEEKKTQIEDVKTATETEETLKKIALANLTYARDLQGKCNRLEEECKRKIEKINESNNARAKKYDDKCLKLGKAMGAMIACYQAIDRNFGNEIRANIEKNNRTQKEGQMRALMEQMQKQDAADPDAAKNRLIDAFAQLGVSVESLKDYVGHELSALDPNELQTLRAIYSAIKDGETSWKAVMDDKAEKDAEAKQATKNGKVATAKATPKQESKKEPEQPSSGDAPTEGSSTTEDNDMFGD